MFGARDNVYVKLISREFQNIIYRCNVVKAVYSLPILNFQAMTHAMESWLITSKKLNILDCIFYTYSGFFFFP